ncbi:imidazoleglycerol-phosphate dehydratase HisB [Candidatus Poribacteria bacterium]|nr:imidazoleglycerol-phosphate dehydratase HisB [Candidatus Poribacteria bacterium]
MGRIGEIERKTRETQIELRIDLDGTGTCDAATGVGFLDHMLELFAKHAFFDLRVRAQGDLHVDAHHTVEDVGICLGMGVAKALGDKAGIRRFGGGTVPMYEALGTVHLDLCGRPIVVFQTPLDGGKVGDFDVELVEEFFHGFANYSGTTIHLLCPYGSNRHHIIESLFKAFARALDQATRPDDRVVGVLSSKGRLE